MNWENFKFFYTDHIQVPLPEGHRFPMEKYRLLREALVKEEILRPSQLHAAPLALREDLLRAHEVSYVSGLLSGTLSSKELRPIGLTWSEKLLERSLASVGGYVASCEAALENGFGALLAGGTHHAHADRGEGFCVFNDFAVAALKLLQEKKTQRILILDLDVHQGNGNSSILGEREDVFIVSLHGEKNYPFRKIKSHLDVPLASGVGDREYLQSLEEALGKINFQFDFIMYQAGVDNLKEDTLGTLNLSFEGLKKRDQMVFEFAHHTPLAMAIGGGYARPIDLTIAAHVNTFKMAREHFLYR
jgi:acetoin utilization deacetylase AcuC-like enzyme